MKTIAYILMFLVLQPFIAFATIKIVDGHYEQVGNLDTRNHLGCSIKLPERNIQPGQPLSVEITLRNNGPSEIQLPFPYGQEPGIGIKFLISSTSSNQVEANSQLVSSQNEPVQTNLMWIGVAPNSEQHIWVQVKIPNSGVEVGPHELQCMIEYHMPKITSASYVKSNQWTKAEVLDSAKKSGKFVLGIDDNLWTGALKSSPVKFTMEQAK